MDRQQSKMLMLSTNVDKKSLETEFSIAICHPTGKQLAIKYTVSSDFWLLRAFSIAAYLVWLRPSWIVHSKSRLSLKEHLNTDFAAIELELGSIFFIKFTVN